MPPSCRVWLLYAVESYRHKNTKTSPTTLHITSINRWTNQSIHWYNLIQNAAKQCTTRMQRRDHVKPVLLQLHWLPVQRCNEFKVASLVHQSLFGQASCYTWQTTAGSCLKPVNVLCSQPMYGAADTKQLRWQQFCCRIPRLWNNLLPCLRCESSCEQFKRQWNSSTDSMALCDSSICSALEVHLLTYLQWCCSSSVNWWVRGARNTPTDQLSA